MSTHTKSSTTTAPTTTREDATPTDIRTLKEELLQIDAQRRQTESQLAEALAYLDSTPAGRDGPLVDADGYPRDDCDLFAVRAARHTVACARHDLLTLEQQSYEKLAELHAQSRATGLAQMLAMHSHISSTNDRDSKGKSSRDIDDSDDATAAAASTAERQAELRRVTSLPAFLRVAAVEMGSPAYTAGLRVGHRIVEFGGIRHICAEKNTAATTTTCDSDNYDDDDCNDKDSRSETQPRGGDGAKNTGQDRECVMRAMSELTRDRENEMISVWVRLPDKEEELLKLFIVPQRWDGSGLLGCAFDVL